MCQGAKFKETPTLRLMQLQDQHLRVSASFNPVSRAPCLPHSGPTLMGSTRGESTIPAGGKGKPRLEVRI